MFKQQYSVLLVDDENCARKLIGERIGKISNVIVAASVPNGFSARKYLREHVVDIIFTDIKMPLMDGLELAGFAKEFVPSCPVVIISGHEEFEYARKAIQYGVKEYLLKPVTFSQIVEVVERCCSEVREKRERLLLPQYHMHEELEQQIYRTYAKGENPDGWLSKLEQLMTHKGTVVRIQAEKSEERGKEELSIIYKNILSEGLPGQLVLRLGYTQEKYEYLIIQKSVDDCRLLTAVPEYLDRILENPVKWTEVGVVNSAQEFETMYASMQTEDGNAQIKAACRYMEKNMGKMITRDEVAEHVWLSPSYFSRLFKQIVGVGYNEYLTELRIKKAKQLLLQNVSVADIAAIVGFSDARYFGIIFHKKTGYTPSEYRRALLTGEVSQEE